MPMPASAHLTAASSRPTRKRYWVMFFAVTLAILSYLDRVCLSKLVPSIQRDLKIGDQQMGLVLSAFGLAYALFEIPGGWMGDWLGARRVLLRIVLWWSACTAAMGAVWNHWSMAALQFLFGAGEAGGFPNLTKAMSVWLPKAERARMQGLMWMFARWGGAVTPILVYTVSGLLSWRMTFVAFGCLGLFWAVPFFLWYRDNPKDRKGVNDAELALLAENSANAGRHANVPWGKLVRSRSVWLLWAQYFFLSYPWYFYITWLPKYLTQQRGLPNTAETAQLNAIPLFFGGIGCIVSGLLARRVAEALGSVGRARKVMATIGFLGAAVLLASSVRIESAVLAMAVMGLASFCNDLVMPGAWATCMDVGGKYAGTLAGSMNMMGNLAGAVAPSLSAFILTATGDWNVVIYFNAGVYILGSLTWPFINPTKPLEEEA